MRSLFRFKSGSAIAMAAAFGLAVSGFGLSAVPAVAKKASNSKEFIAAYKPANEKIEELEGLKASGASEEQINAAVAAALPSFEAAAAAASTDQDKLLAGQFFVTLGGLNGDTKIRQRGAQMMLDSGMLKEEQVPQFQFYLGNFAYGSGDYTTATSALKAAADAGYEHEALVPLLVQSYGKANQPAEGLAVVKQLAEKRIAAGQPVPEEWITRSNAVAYQGNLGAEAIQFSTMLVDQYPSDFNWLSATQVVRSFGGYDPQATLDLFRLMKRSGALDNKREFVVGEYKEYIETADPRKLPGEVVSLIEKGMGNGALQSGDAWAIEARSNASARVAADKASLPGLLKEARGAADGKTALLAGDVALNYGDAAAAEEMYQLALTKGGADANTALSRLGIAQVDQGKYAEAKANFAKVTGPRKSLANLWLVHIANQQSANQAPAS